MVADNAEHRAADVAQSIIDHQMRTGQITAEQATTEFTRSYKAVLKTLLETPDASVA